MASQTPNKWGPQTTQKSFEFFMEGALPSDPQISLLEHALTSPSQELTDPVTAPVQKKVRGRIVTVNKVVLPAEQTGLTYTLLFPSAFWTPALQKARNGGLCETDFFALYLCPEDPQFNLAYIYPDSQLDPPSEVTDFITNTTDTEVLTEQTTLRTTERKILWAVNMSRVADQTNALNAIAFDLDDCVGCSADIWTSLIAAGVPAAGTDAEAQLTENRFASVTAVGMLTPNDAIITSLFSQGDVRLATFSDAAIATGTIGGVAASFDGGLTWALDSNITASMFDVNKFAGQYVAVGGTGAGIGLLYVSNNGIDWTSLAPAAITGTNALNRLAVDEEGGAIYFGGEGGKLYKGVISGGTIAVTDISANLPTVSTLISAIAVLGKNHVIVGAAAGYVAESFDGGATFTRLSFTSASAVTGLAGTRYRTLLTAGTKVFERSILTGMQFKEVKPQGSANTGAFTDLAMAPGDYNYFAATTDAGEVMFMRPFYPNA